MSHSISKQIDEIWKLTKENNGLRDGEKRFIFNKLKDIDFMWKGFAE